MFKYKDYFSKSGEEVLRSFNVTLDGLSSAEAKTRAEKDGLNLIEYKKPDWKGILLRQFTSFFIYLLFFAAAVDLITREILDASFIFAFICIYVGSGFYQEFNAEKSVFNLRKFLTRYVRTKRNDEIKKMNTQDLVPGDLIFLEEGDLIPADVRFLRTRNLTIDESILTGESMEVPKNSAPVSESIENDLDARNLGFSGSSVIGGWGEAVVIATGEHTYFAGIFEKLNSIERPSKFEVNLKKIGEFATFLFFLIAMLIFLIKFITVGHIDLGFFVFVVALVVAVVPEALPLVATLAFSKGSLILAKNSVVIKRLTALEDLGNVDVLCTDKTGTITENKLAIAQYFGEDHAEILRLAFVSSIASKKLNKMHGSFDAAILNVGTKKMAEDAQRIEFLESLPFDAIRKVNSALYRMDSRQILLARGAPEIILESSVGSLGIGGKTDKISQETKDEALAWFKQAGERGERAIAIGFKETAGQGGSLDLKKEEAQGLIFAGMISFTDPLKETSQAAAQLINKLNVKLKIVTGDSNEVAGAVAHQLGLIADPHDVLAGEEFEKMTENERLVAVDKYNVFGRTMPNHKYLIIESLKKRHTVGFLGEGFNDVPALKIADLALVVDNASDVARDAADIVLLKSELIVIGRGIEEGRKIFANVIKYIRTTFAANVGNFFTMVIASFLLPFLPMLSVQILILNLITDLPMVTISLDNVPEAEMQKPQKYDLRNLYIFIILFGLLSVPFDFIFFRSFFSYGESVLQSGWFLFSVFQEVLAFLSLRTLLPIYRGGIPAVNMIVFSILSCFIGAALIFYPPLGQLFHFVALDINQVEIIGGILIAYLFMNEVIKLMYAKFRDRLKMI